MNNSWINSWIIHELIHEVLIFVCTKQKEDQTISDASCSKKRKVASDGSAVEDDEEESESSDGSEAEDEEEEDESMGSADDEEDEEAEDESEEEEGDGDEEEDENEETESSPESTPLKRNQQRRNDAGESASKAAKATLPHNKHYSVCWFSKLRKHVFVDFPH